MDSLPSHRGHSLSLSQAGLSQSERTTACVYVGCLLLNARAPNIVLCVIHVPLAMAAARAGAGAAEGKHSEPSLDSRMH